MMKVTLLFAALALTAALPMENESVSDDAVATVDTLLQAGKSKSACKDLADSTIKEINNAVGTAEKLIKNLDTGKSCAKEGQGSVDKAKKGLQDAQKKSDDAHNAATKACNAKVTFGPKKFSSLKKGNCDTFFNDPKYTKAKKKCDKANEKATKAKGALDEAKKGLKNAGDAAKKEKNECECKAKKAHANAVKAAGDASSKANKKAWTKAHHMLCVLDGKHKNCKVPALPAVKVPSLAKGVNKAVCKTTKPKKKKMGRI
jgi:hypothetical protein